jgi:gliding motility-associated lipoprotein GldH
MSKNIIKILFLVVVAGSLFGCNSNVVFDKNEKIKKDIWKMDDKKAFTVKVSDVDERYRFAINLRNTTDYKYNNIYFFVTTIYPDGSITRKDTVECLLSYPDGTWKGKGNADIKDNRFWFAKNVIFKQKGEYVFKIEQATRDTNLVGIKDVGLHIEKQRDN